MSDELKFVFEQERKLVNRTALEKWIANGCPLEEDKEVLGNYNHFTV